MISIANRTLQETVQSLRPLRIRYRAGGHLMPKALVGARGKPERRDGTHLLSHESLNHHSEASL